MVRGEGKNEENKKKRKESEVGVESKEHYSGRHGHWLDLTDLSLVHRASSAVASVSVLPSRVLVSLLLKYRGYFLLDQTKLLVTENKNRNYFN